MTPPLNFLIHEVNLEVIYIKVDLEPLAKKKIQNERAFQFSVKLNPLKTQDVHKQPHAKHHLSSSHHC